jgi:hypothetical protein
MAIEAVPVDVKLRRGVHPVPDAFLDIALYPVRVRAADDLVAEPVSLQPDPRRVADQGLEIELRRGPQQELVHLPEFALRGGRLSGFRSLLRVGVKLRNGEVPEDEPDQAGEPLKQPVHVACRAPAVRAFIVAVLDDGHGRVGWAEKVVLGRDHR